MNRNSAVGSRYSSNSRPDSNHGLSHNSIDLDVSRLSHSGSVSSVSTVTLGGCHYPVGSTVGTSGLFVIGDPKSGSKSRSQSPHSTYTSPSIRHLVISQGYDFEDWNWPVIRFSLLILLIAVMIGLLAATIALTVQAQYSCITTYEWWQGSVIYRIPVVEFFDGTRNDYVGDFNGIEQKVDYLQYLGVSVVSLTFALPSMYPFWNEPTSFNLTGSLAPQGSWQDFRSMVNTLHRWDIKVILEMNASYTATEHPWFQESLTQDSNVGNNYRNFYIWQSEIPTGSFADTWEFNSRRNQYYQHDHDPRKPILNWDESWVNEEFRKELVIWLNNGIDGFYIADLERFYGGTASKMLSVLSSWSYDLKDFSFSDYDRKVIMVSSMFLEKMQAENPNLLGAVKGTVQLVDHQFSLNSSHLSHSVVDALKEGVVWQVGESDPWVSWRWANMSRVSQGNWSAIEMLMMTFPGTPCLTAGQEVGRHPEPEHTFYAEGRLRPVQWSDGLNSLPFQTGSALDISNIGPLITTMRVRQDEDPLRSKRDSLQDAGRRDDYHSYDVPFVDEATLLLKRHFGVSDEFYVAADLSWVPQTRDWSSSTTGGNVVTDTMGVASGNVKFSEVSLDKGQALLLKVLK